MNIGRRYWPAEVDNFCEEQKKAVQKYVDNFEKYYKDGNGLYIYGANGGGKSYISAALCKHVWSKYRIFSYCLTAGELNAAWKSFKDPIWANSEELVIDRIVRIPFLVIDDLGKEYRPKKDSSGFSEDSLGNLLRERSRELKITIITSNLSPVTFKEIYGESTAQLCKEYLIPVTIVGKNWREEKQSQIRQEFF
jgi:DNA replication protein DnaC